MNRSVLFQRFVLFGRLNLSRAHYLWPHKLQTVNTMHSAVKILQVSFGILYLGMPEFIPKTFKSIINKMKFIDPWFWNKYTLNPYNGCQFGCIYCDARSARYYMPEDFDNKIIIKQNVATMLDKRVSGARTFLPDVVALGGVTDPYQPAEKRFENTRSCLKILAKHRYPVHIITKSTLVLRDLELLEKIGRNAWCSVSITLPTTNEKAARFLDNHAPAPARRLDVIRQIKQRCKHIQTGVLLIPLVPFITDSNSDLTDIARKTQSVGADYLLFGGGMTMRDQQALWFLQHLKQCLPDLLEKYEQLYSFKYTPEKYAGRYQPTSGYLLPKHRKLFELCRESKLPFRIKRFIPEDDRKLNYQVSERLFEEVFVAQMLGGNWYNLSWVAQNIQNLTEPLEAIIQRNELGKICNVRGAILEKIKILAVELAAKQRPG